MTRTSTALVIIDVQCAILDGLGGRRPTETARELDSTVGRIAGLLDKARTSQIAVVHVQHDGAPGHRLEAGKEGWLIRPELTPGASESVVRKRSCDSFFQTSLADELGALGIERLVIAGCMTQFCVDTSARRAVTLGYDVVLAADGHMTADSGKLTFEQIIAHHNSLLDGSDAAGRTIKVQPCRDIEF